jgi:hypothetical protein
MATGMIDIMKRAAMDAVQNGKPCDLRFGTVVSTAPLKVQITTELVIPESLLVVPEYLTDYSVDVNIGSEKPKSQLNVSLSEETLVFSMIDLNDTGEDVGESVDERTLTVYNTLRVGDKVALVRNQGGKVYYILDRV